VRWSEVVSLRPDRSLQKSVATLC